MEFTQSINYLDPSLRLRSNNNWNLIILDKISKDLDDFGVEINPDTYGILQSRFDKQAKIIGPDTALLFLTLREPMTLPSYVRASFGKDANNAVYELILDGILEVELNKQWATGPAAIQQFQQKRNSQFNYSSPNSSQIRSKLAIETAVSIPTDDPKIIASFLYRYGTTPVLPSRSHLWSDSNEIYTNLNLKSFVQPLTLSKDSAWWVFHGNTENREEFSPKLYVGVSTSELPEAILRICKLWNKYDGKTPSFKIGASISNLHRPDCLVFYPSTIDETILWSKRLETVIADLHSSYVPFTCATNSSGSVSWGVDPSIPERTSWNSNGSWRSMIVEILAKAIVTARLNAQEEPWKFALERIRFSGINPDTWALLEIEGRF